MSFMSYVVNRFRMTITGSGYLNLLFGHVIFVELRIFCRITTKYNTIINSGFKLSKACTYYLFGFNFGVHLHISFTVFLCASVPFMSISSLNSLYDAS